MTQSITVHVPATTANIGPGFDCLGMALDLWNETTFSLDSDTLHISITGEGESQLPADGNNLIYQSFCRTWTEAGKTPPDNVRIACHNRIPLGSGLGSSSAAIVTGVIGANALMGNPFAESDMLRIATKIEGHPDNVAPAILGGLTVSVQQQQQVLTRRILAPVWQVVVVLPAVSLSTETARRALPKTVPLADAVSNIGHTALVIQALQQGDLPLLQASLQDALHQPYRLPLIRGAAEAIQAAQALGAPAALSGAGPSVIAFCENGASVAEAMQAAFRREGVPSRTFLLTSTERGAHVFSDRD